MRYRAICPDCHVRLSRRGYFHPWRDCGRCGATIRPAAKWEFLGNLVIGTIILVGMFFGCLAGGLLFRSPLGAVAVATLVLLCALMLGWILWPFVTVYELVKHAKRQRCLCASCGYDLRATPDRCPE